MNPRPNSYAESPITYRDVLQGGASVSEKRRAAITRVKRLTKLLSVATIKLQTVERMIRDAKQFRSGTAVQA